MDADPPRRLDWLLVGIILAGAALRILLLTDNRFHPDEALFVSLGRLIISGQDPLLVHTGLLVDKPPLFYYLLAAGISACWGCEISARLPGLVAGVLSIALTARLARELWHSTPADHIAGLFVALSPFAILFSPTAFADPQMTAWLIASLLAVSLRRWGWGGLLFGLALATKQNVVFFLPLVLILGLTAGFQASGSTRTWLWDAIRFALGIGVIVGLMFIWDAARGSAAGFWVASVDVNNPGRLIRSNEVWPRAMRWLWWLDFAVGIPRTGIILIIAVLALAIVEVARHSYTRAAAITLALVAFCVGYLSFLWLVAFPTFDRYLLPTIPLFALLAGRGVVLMAGWLRAHTRRAQVSLLAGLVLLMGNPAWRALHSDYPVGGDHGAYDGIDQVSTYLDTLPDGTVVYHQSLAWLLSCYLFDIYVYPSGFNAPADLTADLQRFGGSGEPRYLVLSQWDSPVEVFLAVEEAGFSGEPVFQTVDRFGRVSFVVYRLVPVD